MDFKEMKEAENCICHAANGKCSKDLNDIFVKGKKMHTKQKECSFTKGKRCLFYDSYPRLYHIDQMYIGAGIQV